MAVLFLHEDFVVGRSDVLEPVILPHLEIVVQVRIEPSNPEVALLIGDGHLSGELGNRGCGVFRGVWRRIDGDLGNLLAVEVGN